MKGVNRVTLLGRLGQDPEIRYTPEGKAIANLTLATSESWKDQQGNQQEKTEWHRVVVFGKLAEIVGEYLRKGSQVYFEGKLQTRKWQDQQGQDRYTTEVVVDGFTGQMQMLGGKNDHASQGANNAQHQQSGYQQQPQQQGGFNQQQSMQQQQGGFNQQAQNQGFAPQQQVNQNADAPF